MSSSAPDPSGEPTTLPVITEYIGVRPGYCGGEPHILGHRIKVRHVAVWHEQMGMTPTEIAATTIATRSGPPSMGSIGSSRS